ncbi:MAG TPA: hypothetical protein VNE63_08160 [Candidatus Acidoferrales bacterium]|nr:hypothetical protein [Candidatus Acidoferrales bacterium]
MNPFLKHLSYGGGAAGTVLHPIVAAMMVLVVILTLVLPRKYVVAPMLFCIFLTPYGQEIMVAGVHVFVFRILILFGWVRLVSAKLGSKTQIFASGLNTLDKVFFLWAIFRALAPMLLFQQMGMVVNQVGFLWDAIGGYFLLRFLIQDDEDVERIIKMLAVFAVIVGAEMVHEHFTGDDMFAMVGGIRPTLDIRNGIPRAMGPFAHALLAGTVGATLLPFFVWLWTGGKAKLLAAVGIIGCTLMASLTMCSSPVLAFAAGVGAMFLWPLRHLTRAFRWGIVFACAGLQLFMKAPFWFVISHLDVVGGSNGWYRAALINDFIVHFRSWWLIGTTANMSWGNGAMWDQCNQFVSEGETGGLLTLILFIAMICICFSWIGTARKSVEGDRRKQWYFWLLGSVLFVHLVGFFGIDYFDQTKFVWYALLAMIVAATAPVLAAQTAHVPEPEGLRAGLAVLDPLAAWIPYRSRRRGPRESHAKLSNLGIAYGKTAWSDVRTVQTRGPNGRPRSSRFPKG